VSEVKIILEPDETIEDVKEELVKAIQEQEIKPKQFIDPVLEDIHTNLTDKFHNMLEHMYGEISEIMKLDDETLKMRKSLKGKTPTFSGYKLQDQYKFQGLDISIENKAGSFREWEDRHGERGKTKMKYDYGYIKRTLAKDGDHIDCYIGPDKESPNVYIVHQQIDGKFDEDKVMLGCKSKGQAKRIYLMHGMKLENIQGIDMMDIEEFKEKVLGKKVEKIK
jgi:inorganic pyrophosphatase